MSNKQDKLTNPLTQSDVINNLSNTSTYKPLSANMGKYLSEHKAALTDLPSISTGSASYTSAVQSGVVKLTKYGRVASIDGVLNVTGSASTNLSIFAVSPDFIPIRNVDFIIFTTALSPVACIAELGTDQYFIIIPNSALSNSELRIHIVYITAS